MTITAWTEDGQGYQSKETIETIKYDSIEPEITNLTLEATYGSNNWITSIGNIKIQAKDSVGILNGYEYEVTDIEGKTIKERTYVPEIETPIKIEKDGQYVVKIQVKDQAGNLSKAQTIEVHKDSEKPTVGEPRIETDRTTATSFLITCGAGDDLSGVWKYDYYVNGVKNNKTDITTGSYTVTGLKANQTYEIYVRVYDRAGNYKDTMKVPALTTGELKPPKIEISGTNKNGYYTGNVTVKITDTVEANATSTKKITYNQNGTETTVQGTSYTYTLTNSRKLYYKSIHSRQ